MTGQSPSRRVSGEMGRAEVRGDVVHVAGEIDWSNLHVLRSALAQVSEQVDSGFVIDLTEVTFLDSGAVSTLFKLAPRRPRLLVRKGSVPERLLTERGLVRSGLLDIRT
jgi:ABC-type transporter Mla MlaB component